MGQRSRGQHWTPRHQNVSPASPANPGHWEQCSSEGPRLALVCPCYHWCEPNRPGKWGRHAGMAGPQELACCQERASSPRAHKLHTALPPSSGWGHTPQMQPAHPQEDCLAQSSHEITCDTRCTMSAWSSVHWDWDSRWIGNGTKGLRNSPNMLPRIRTQPSTLTCQSSA